MAFTGRAIYDTSVFDGVREDVAEEIGMISPSETPLLDMLGDAQYPARNVVHEWLEESLRPNTLIASTAASTSGTALAVHSAGTAVGDYLMVGAILKNNDTGEYMQITATGGNTISVTRAFGGTTAGVTAVGNTLTVIADAALEGADVGADVSRPRKRRGNTCMIFKSDIVISGTEQAVSHIGVGNEFEHQKQNRIREALRDLEKAVILSKSSGTTLGSSTAYRAFTGLWDFISTNSTSSGTLTVEILEDVIQSAWAYGANDLDLIVCDATFKRIIDGWNTSRVEVTNDDERFHQRVTRFEGTFGDLPVLLSRWMPTKTLMVLSTQRVKVLPLASRSFSFKPVAETGDASKGLVVGEYTLQVTCEEGMSKLFN